MEKGNDLAAVWFTVDSHLSKHSFTRFGRRISDSTGLGAQLGGFRHGIGTDHPFRFLTFEGKNADELKAALDECKVSGLSFQKKSLTNAKGEVEAEGVYMVLSDWNAWNQLQS